MRTGRSQHHATRRRMYSARQRALRERRLHAARGGERWIGDEIDEFAVIEIEGRLDFEDGLDFEAPSPWHVRLSGRSNAA